MGLVAHYKLDGNANDSCGTYNGTANSVSWVDGKIGQCGSFNGSSSVVNCGNGEKLNLTNYGSISVWAKPSRSYPSDTTSTVFRSIVGKVSSGSTGQQSYFIDWYGTNTTRYLRGNIGYSTGNVGPNISFDFGQNWVHICLIWDGNKISLYANGNMIGEQTQTQMAQIQTSDLRIGNFFSDWDGLIDDVRIYDHALSLKEVKELSKAKILHYKFDDFQEPTENLLLNPTFITTNNWLLSKNGAGTFTVNNQWGKINIPAGETDKYYYLEQSLVRNTPANQPVTFSVDFKNDVVGKYALRLVMYVGGTVPQQPMVSINLDGTGGIKRCSVTASHTAISDRLRLDILAGSYYSGFSNNSVEFTNAQLEQKDHATPFVNGFRTGTVIDCSGYDNHAELALATTPQWVEDSRIGSGAYYFQKRVDCGNNQILRVTNDFTVSLWVKTLASTTSSNKYFIGRYDTGNNKRVWGIVLRADTYCFSVLTSDNGTGANVKYTNGSVVGNDGVWHHISFTHKNGITKLYIDGSLNIENTTYDTLFDTDVNLILNNSQIAIYMDDVRIYATALSDQDILDLYEERASLDNQGNLYIDENKEYENLALLINNAINNKTFSNGLSSYTQTNCQVTLTDRGYRIYRPPNLTVATDGNTMWGGLRVRLFSIDPNIIQKNHKYRISFMVKGQSSNSPGAIYFTNQMGWGGGGLSSVPASEYNSIDTNFQGEKEIYAIFNITDDIWKVCTTSYSSFVAGQMYNCYKDLCWGFGYTSTGSLGTDLYITNFKVQDITDGAIHSLDNQGVLTYEVNECSITENLIAWYPLSGSAIDLCNMNDGTVSGATVAQGLNQLAYSFDGVDDYISIPPPLVFNSSFTVSLWVNHTTASRSILFGDYALSGSINVNFEIYASNLLRFYWAGSPDIAGSSVVSTNTFHHIVFIRDKENSKIYSYIDGVIDINYSGSIADKIATGRFYIGRDNRTGDTAHEGLIQDVRIYNRALSPEEVQILYNTTGHKHSKMEIFNNKIYLAGSLKEV